MNNDYGMLVCKQCIEEISTGASAGIGAGIGASLAAGGWAKRRIILQNKMKKCEDL